MITAPFSELLWLVSCRVRTANGKDLTWIVCSYILRGTDRKSQSSSEPRRWWETEYPIVSQAVSRQPPWRSRKRMRSGLVAAPHKPPTIPWPRRTIRLRLRPAVFQALPVRPLLGTHRGQNVAVSLQEYKQNIANKILDWAHRRPFFNHNNFFKRWVYSLLDLSLLFFLK